MIRFRIQELMAEKQFQEGRRLTVSEVSAATGINRVTLSKMINQRGYSTVTDTLDKLFAYFGCRIEQLVEYVPDSPAQERS